MSVAVSSTDLLIKGQERAVFLSIQQKQNANTNNKPWTQLGEDELVYLFVVCVCVRRASVRPRRKASCCATELEQR